MELYTLSTISKVYERRTVLQLDDLVVNEGETVALIGPSGAGKSTLLRLLAFLEPATSGTIYYQGHRVTVPIPLVLQREVTLVFQRPILLDTSVERNVEFGLRIRGRTTGDAVGGVLDSLGLGPLRRARARTLSGGEAQRVALARALVIEPRVLLLDEPTANLDPANVAVIEAVLGRLRQRGTTVVIATHNLHQARRLADRVAVLLDGELIEVGPSGLVLGGHALDERTRAFVSGTMVY